MSTKKTETKHKTSEGRLELRNEFVYTAAETADLLHLSLRIIRAAIGRGELTAAKVANRLIVRGFDVETYLRRHRVYRGNGKN